eukprot:13648484-Alexandrium_andersonii.AAC.1
MQLVDLPHHHMRVSPPEPRKRGIDLHEITHPPYADGYEICRKTKAKDEIHPCVGYTHQAENL